MKRKGLSISLSVLLVMVLAVSFSVPVEAASRTYYPTYTVSKTINKTHKDFFPTNVKPNFNVREYIESDPYLYKPVQGVSGAIWSSSTTRTYCDFYEYTGGGIGSFDRQYDGVILKITTSGMSFSTSMISSISVALGTKMNVSENKAVAFINSNHKNHSTIFDVDFHEYGWDSYYFWVYGQGAYYTRIHADGASTGTTTYNYASYAVSGTIKVEITPYKDCVASSSDIQNQTDSINNNITKQTQQQTNTLTGGYDNSGMEDSNTALSGSMNDYAAVEDQAMNQSVSYIDDVGFVSPASNSSIFAAITFTSSWLQSLFNNMGDWSLLILVSLSLSLGLMLIGWFKYR